MAGGHGGKRRGAGRPAGSGWKPRVAAMRSQSITNVNRILAREDDPLSTVVNFVLDAELDVQTRLQAASIALPYLYPRLSAATVDARVTTTNVDATRLVERLNERLEKLAADPVRQIEAKPDRSEGDG